MEYVLLAAVGLATGVLGGMMGIGGSVIMLPAMVWLLGAKHDGVEQIHQYQAAAMIVNFLLILPSVSVHFRRGAIWKRVWMLLSVGALIGVIAGVWISGWFVGDAAHYLRWILGAFFIYVASYNAIALIRPLKSEGLDQAQVDKGPRWRKLGVGLFIGVTSGLTGVGGGALAVPLQQSVLRMPLRNAIATSSAMIATFIWFGALLKNLQLGEGGSIHRSLVLAGCLAPTAMIGSYFGGHLTHILPLHLVRLAFVLLMGASAFKMIAG